MIDFTTLNNVAKSIAGVQEGVSLIDQGTRQNLNTIYNSGIASIQGYQMQANSFFDAIQLNQQVSLFNQNLDTVQTVRTINQLSQEYHRIAGTQLNQQAATGFDVGSKSAQLVREDTLANYQQQIKMSLQDAENTRRAKEFEDKIQEAALRKQGVAAQMNANAASINTSIQMNNARLQGQAAKYKLLSGSRQVIPTLLSNIKIG